MSLRQHVNRQFAPKAGASLAGDLAPFIAELKALRDELAESIGPGDFAHLRAIERWGRLFTLVGYATAWLCPNPLSALLLAQGNTVRWTVIMHHVLHGGYDQVPGIHKRYTKAGFAAGWRRFVDWLDWIHPEAWKYEHNMLHHFHTGEIADPDLVESNLDWLRQARLPILLKLCGVAFFACTWKLTYYAPMTFRAWRTAVARRSRNKSAAPPNRLADAFNPLSSYGRAFLCACVLPYAVVQFFAIPLLFLALGPWAAYSVLVNSVMGELAANIHSFLLITPNHAAQDLPRFRGRPADRAEFYLRQVVGTVNYSTGHPILDFLHGWLNLHREHHLWPDLPLQKYQRLQPRLAALCSRYRIPYQGESIFRRTWKTLKLMVGKASMLDVPAVLPLATDEVDAVEDQDQ